MINNRSHIDPEVKYPPEDLRLVEQNAMMLSKIDQLNSRSVVTAGKVSRLSTDAAMNVMLVPRNMQELFTDESEAYRIAFSEKDGGV